MRMSPFKKAILIAILVPAAIQAGLMVKSHFKSNQPSPAYFVQAPAQSQNEMMPADISGSNTGQKISGSSRTVLAFSQKQPDTYQLAVANYSAKRLQFDNCAVTTPLVGGTYTSGSELMIEGASPDTQYVYLNNRKIVLDGYAFVLIHLPQVKKVQTFTVNCQTADTMQYNVAMLTVYP